MVIAGEGRTERAPPARVGVEHLACPSLLVDEVGDVAVGGHRPPLARRSPAPRRERQARARALSLDP